MEKLPVSIIICALNEEKRIQGSIESAIKSNPLEIIVVEGGSTDKTVEIAKKFTDNVVSLTEISQFGIGYKRALGAELATSKYVFYLDSDHVLPDGALNIMISELEENGYTGIQSNVKSLNATTYWENGMEYNIGLTHSNPGPTNMIGMPCLYVRETLVANNFNKAVTGGCDDTDLCYRLTQKGYTLGISSAVSYQLHRSSLRTTYNKFTWYGEGDCVFASLHPERFWSIFTHPIRNYVIKRSYLAFIKGDFKYIPYFIFTGVVRHLGYYRFLIKRLFGNTIDVRVANRHKADF